MMEQAKFSYSLLEKAFGKQTKTISDSQEKHTKALESLNFSSKINDLKQVEDIFSDN